VLVDKMHEACPISNAILDNVYVRLAVVLTFEVSSPEMHEREESGGKEHQQVVQLSIGADTRRDGKEGTRMSTNNGHILVLGATGLNGGVVARQLITEGLKPRLLIRAASRSKAAEFEDQAVIVEGDLEDEASLEKAFRGIEKLYLVSANYNGSVAGRFIEERAIDAAKMAGVVHVVKLSTFKADDTELLLGQWHGSTEKHLIESGMDWTMLRPVGFHTNALLMWAASIKAKAAFYQPTGDGRWASIDPVDIGAVAVKALTSAGHTSKIYTLTGPDSTNAAGYAAKLSAVLGKSITFIDIPPETMRAGMAVFGFPKDQVDAALQVMASVKANEWDIVSSDIQIVLGRAAISFEDWATRNAASFL
jgi:uncharacterized protein YbjT (DUF2867 family)